MKLYRCACGWKGTKEELVKTEEVDPVTGQVLYSALNCPNCSKLGIPFCNGLITSYAAHVEEKIK